MKEKMDGSLHSQAILEHLHTQATAGMVSYAQFSRTALFLPQHGYYAQEDRQRVGKSADTDFYTSSSLKGGVFARLLLNAFENLLGRDFCETATLVEIAAEPGAGLFEKEKGIFKDTLTLRLGDELKLPERAVVFANEWLDAQPFHSFKMGEDGWTELGVDVSQDTLKEVTLPCPTPAGARFIAEKLADKDAPIGYRLDISLEAPQLLEKMAAQNFKGAFVTADYGRTFSELLEMCPEGTARAFFKHQVSGKLLNNPGTQDLTCDVCWDDLSTILNDCGFSDIQIERQERFFMRHALPAVSKIIEQSPVTSPEKRALTELLHPGALGARFEVLCAIRKS